MYLGLLWTLATIIVVSQALVGEKCTVDSQCDPSECCQILSEFMLASKRQGNSLTSIVQPLKPDPGTCQKYKVEGDPCNKLDKMYGECSCAPGTYCHAYEISTVSARSFVFENPGDQWISRCEKQDA
ncbi:uncharacterized protein LOC129927691 [Biomphalaria glabrata]|uniref:Uncharacterized protein LOC129927691 n=1 Tax=Biomphalaria glabrata TaxID=6526 RepID=A0A9W3B2Z3_BIOGL|nr:uncharacterized protein LOC129927691 [Biomphalaria glabrata]KAI8757440.1 U3-aranetoxin-Ce1a-like [Biomphalaria glabrata]